MVTKMRSMRTPQRLLLTTTTWWPSVALLAAVLEEAGFTVTVLCPRGHPAWTARITGCLEMKGRHPFRALREAIDRTDPAMIVPTDDRAVSHLHAFHARASVRIKALIERSLGSPASFGTALSRNAMLTAARAAGMATPNGRAIDGAADLDGLPFPFVLKLDGTTGGQGVRIIRTREEARAGYRDLMRQKGALFAVQRRVINRDPFWLMDRRMGARAVLSAQSFVEGRAGNLALFCQAGEILGATLAQSESSAHDTGPSTFVRIVEGEDFLEQARVLVRKLGLSGFCGLDFIIDKATGHLVLIEMNPRITPLAALRPGHRQDPVAGAAMALLGHGAASAPPLPPRELHACFPTAWRFHPGDDRLELCRSDLPHAHPELVAEALRTPWTHRSLLARSHALGLRLRRSRVTRLRTRAAGRNMSVP